MKRKPKPSGAWPRLLAALLVLQLAACAQWERVGADNARYEASKNDYVLTQPVGWVRHTAGADELFLTRDGPALNFIVASRQPHDRKLPGTKRETRADMLPIDLADLAIAEWKSSAETENLEVVANAPATVGGKPAVRLHIRWRNERGLPIDRLVYALVDARGRFSLIYQAPAIVYFERGLPAFEGMVQSLQFK